MYGEREIEIESKINRSSGKEDLLGSSWAGQFGPALQSDLMAAGARKPGIDFLENQILLPRASSSLPPSLSRSVSLSSLYGAGWQVWACQRKSDKMWEDGDGRHGFCLASPWTGPSPPWAGPVCHLDPSTCL